MTVFGDSFAKLADDPDHSEDETRLILVGESNQMRLLFVSFTEREENIRIIGARQLTRKERDDYEESTDG